MADLNDKSATTTQTAPPQSIMQKRTPHSAEASQATATNDPILPLHHRESYMDRPLAAWERFNGKGKHVPGWWSSFVKTVTHSWLNVLLICLPIVWALHFTHVNPRITFAFAILGIVPLEKMFDFLGEQMALYCGQSIGDLIVITLNNAVEVSLAIILLTKCRLRLLQATLIGVVVLHLLLIPGAAFLTGGAKIWQQHLHEHPTQLNHVILTMGVVTLLLPAAFFGAMNEPSVATQARGSESLVERSFAVLSEHGAASDETRGAILQFSRGLSVLLLLVYICSRIYLHNPPGDGNALTLPPNATRAEVKQEEKKQEADPEVNPWAGLLMIIITVGIMAATAEWLVEALEPVVGEEVVTEEWLGLVLLPFVSFAGDGFVAVGYFIARLLRYKTVIPEELAKGRAIDMSIQFLTLWLPFLVLLSWWIDKPLSLLFDLFEVVVLTGSCFLVNYVTADAKTNWAEGFVMVIFYVMIAVTAWFYPGQLSHGHLLACAKSVAESVAGVNSGAAEGTAEGTAH
ncbi:hypothetical protein FRC01_012432 [Tulasnella sp. 417]|nr:hypothetical protein FRC01_012432 [Tulasnella sp. 417]